MANISFKSACVPLNILCYIKATVCATYTHEAIRQTLTGRSAFLNIRRLRGVWINIAGKSEHITYFHSCKWLWNVCKSMALSLGTKFSFFKQCDRSAPAFFWRDKLKQLKLGADIPAGSTPERELLPQIQPHPPHPNCVMAVHPYTLHDCTVDLYEKLDYEVRKFKLVFLCALILS